MATDSNLPPNNPGRFSALETLLLLVNVALVAVGSVQSYYSIKQSEAAIDSNKLTRRSMETDLMPIIMVVNPGTEDKTVSAVSDIGGDRKSFQWLLALKNVGRGPALKVKYDIEEPYAGTGAENQVKNKRIACFDAEKFGLEAVAVNAVSTNTKYSGPLSDDDWGKRGTHVVTAVRGVVRYQSISGGSYCTDFCRIRNGNGSVSQCPEEPDLFVADPVTFSEAQPQKRPTPPSR
jgi:hypothetical protein